MPRPASEPKAYATPATAAGNRFAASSLHTAAHEAAHVVQQRAGVHLKGGLGEAGDAYEQHADAVADAVVRGESAEGLLGAVHVVGDSGPAIQRKERPKDLFGESEAAITLRLLFRDISARARDGAKRKSLARRALAASEVSNAIAEAESIAGVGVVRECCRA